MHKQNYLNISIGKIIDETINDNLVKKYGLNQEEIKNLGNIITQEVQKWIETRNDIPTYPEIRNFVRELLFNTDKNKMEKDVSFYQKHLEKLGNYIDANDFEKVKHMASTLISNALEKGVNVILDGKKIESPEDIDGILGSYTDPAKLISDIEKLIASWNDDNLITKITKEKDLEALRNIPPEEVEVTLNSKKWMGMDIYTKIGNSKYFENECLYGFNKTRLKEKAENFLNTKVRTEVKKQLEITLKKYGVPFNCIEDIFNSAVQETLNLSELFEKGYKINILDLAESCISIFNNKLKSFIEGLKQPVENPVPEEPTIPEGTQGTGETQGAEGAEGTKGSEGSEEVTTTEEPEETDETEENPATEDITTSDIDLDNFKKEIATLLKSSKRKLYTEYHSQMDTYGKVRMFNEVFLSTSNATLGSITDTTTSAETIITNFETEFRKNFDTALDIMNED